jgi:hypothetical protein
MDYVSEVSVSKVMITPDMAKSLLENNPINRSPSGVKVREYAHDMTNGNFMFAGHTVCVSKDRKLLDGQQRLMACVKSGRPFHTILVENLPEHVIKVMDSGKKRTYADQLKMEGYSHPAQLASAVKMLILIAQMDPKDHGYTISQLNSVFNKHKELSESVNFCKGTYKKADPILSAIHYIANQTGWEHKADQFIQTWKGGIQNYPNDPIVYIREKLYEDLGKVKKMTTITRMRYIMYSWQKFKDDMPIQKAQPKTFFMEGWDKDVCGLE